MERKRIRMFLSISLFTISVILLMSTVILSILYGIERTKTKTHQKMSNENNKSVDLCLTPYCIEAGERQFS